MTDFQSEKAVVRSLYDALSGADAGSVADVLSGHVAEDWLWRGMHPWHERVGAQAVAEAFWSPFLGAMTRVQRRPDIFLAGRNEMDGFESVWVVSMGHLMGLFDGPWLGIRPTRRIAMLRYAEFNRVEGGRVAETAFFCDIPHVMAQAGQNPLPPQTGAQLVQPGPMTHAGLMWDRQDPARGEATLRAINAMLKRMDTDPKNQTPEEVLGVNWHDDMIWWGPTGVGATYTIERYQKQHVEPFDAALLDEYRFNGHLCRLAEGDFGGFFGWANLTLRNSGGYMGMTAGPQAADMRVVDMYRAEDGKLAENWIFIDMLHYLNMQGLDVLGRMEEVRSIH